MSRFTSKSLSSEQSAYVSGIVQMVLTSVDVVERGNAIEGLARALDRDRSLLDALLQDKSGSKKLESLITVPQTDASLARLASVLLTDKTLVASTSSPYPSHSLECLFKTLSQQVHLDWSKTKERKDKDKKKKQKQKQKDKEESSKRKRDEGSDNDGEDDDDDLPPRVPALVLQAGKTISEGIEDFCQSQFGVHVVTSFVDLLSVEALRSVKKLRAIAVAVSFSVASHAREFARDRSACRALASVLKAATAMGERNVWDTAVNGALCRDRTEAEQGELFDEMMIDPTGSYSLEAIFLSVPDVAAWKTLYTQNFTRPTSVIGAAKHSKANFVVQRVVESVPDEETALELLGRLLPEAEMLLRDRPGVIAAMVKAAGAQRVMQRELMEFLRAQNKGKEDGLSLGEWLTYGDAGSRHVWAAGVRIYQALFSFGMPHSASLFSDLLAIGPQRLRFLAKTAPGSHLLDACIASRTVRFNEKAQVAELFEGRWVELAMNAHASHVVEHLYLEMVECDFTKHFKGIEEELTAAAGKVTTVASGRHLLRVIGAKATPAEVTAEAARREDKKRKLEQEIFVE
mmetsp:Transcript_4486/g.14547  ORF Transcript_4486/g.14547 Transcript_4486/m.14547 type:complete len:573 (-) Transcript_4486:879-2597(-)